MLVKDLDVAVEGGNLAPLGRIDLAGCCCYGRAFGFETGPAEHGPQLSWGPSIGFDLDWVTRLVVGAADVDGPGLTPLAAPVPAEVFDGLVDVVSDDVDVGVLAGPAHADVAEFPAAP